MAIEINPFELPDDQKGWRGIEVTGRPRRRVITVLETDQVLVTALLQIPGEPGVRHSHGTGELSFRWGGDMTPFITWHPPGEWHGGIAETRADKSKEVAEGLALLRSNLKSGAAEVESLLNIAATLQEQIDALQHQARNAKGPAGGPALLIDLLFPPLRNNDR